MQKPCWSLLEFNWWTIIQGVENPSSEPFKVPIATTVSLDGLDPSCLRIQPACCIRPPSTLPSGRQRQTCAPPAGKDIRPQHPSGETRLFPFPRLVAWPHRHLLIPDPFYMISPKGKKFCARYQYGVDRGLAVVAKDGRVPLVWKLQTGDLEFNISNAALECAVIDKSGVIYRGWLKSNIVEFGLWYGRKRNTGDQRPSRRHCNKLHNRARQKRNLS